MIEARSEPRLAEKALAKLGVLDVTRREDLEGDVPVEASVVRPVHLAHAAASDQLLDLVAADLDTTRDPFSSVIADRFSSTWHLRAHPRPNRAARSLGRSGAQRVVVATLRPP